MFNFGVLLFVAPYKLRFKNLMLQFVKVTEVSLISQIDVLT